MRYWQGDKPVKMDEDIHKRLTDDGFVAEEDQAKIARLFTHIMIDGMKLSKKEEYEWRTCGILKTGMYHGRERDCIDLYWMAEDDNDDHDIVWQMAIMLKERTLRCHPPLKDGGEFIFTTNQTYEEFLKDVERRIKERKEEGEEEGR